MGESALPLSPIRQRPLGGRRRRNVMSCAAITLLGCGALLGTSPALGFSTTPPPPLLAPSSPHQPTWRRSRGTTNLPSARRPTSRHRPLFAASLLNEWKDKLTTKRSPLSILSPPRPSSQETTAVEFLKSLLSTDYADSSPPTWIASCREDVEFIHASFDRPWQGTEQIERQWNLLKNAAALSPSRPELEVVTTVRKPGKLAIRFNWGDVRGIAVVGLDDKEKVQSVVWVNETSAKAGPQSLQILRAATRVMEITGFNPAEQLVAPTETSSQQLAPLAYFHAWNRRDMDSALDVFADDVTYDDTAFPEPFQGKEKLKAHLNICADCFPDTFSFQVDDFVAGEGQVCVQWHVENNGETLPYTQGCSFYELNSKGLIKDGIDFVEPNGPIKPGAVDLWRDTLTLQIRKEPARLVPLVVWIAYIGIVFFSDGILPGANALALEQRTWEEVLNFALNFFFVSPLLHLPFSPVVHPMLESVFNGLLAWAALFSGFFTDDRREKPNIFPMFPAVVGMQFLTSAFFLPYLVFRSSETTTLTQEDIQDNLPATVGENRALPAVLASIGSFSIFWAVQGRLGDFGSFPERWTSFVELLSIDRVGSSFIVDLAIFALFQGWLVEDDAFRRGGVNPLLKNVAKYVPFFGLAAYLAFRPGLPEKQN